jgi:hypothetical protein
MPSAVSNIVQVTLLSDLVQAPIDQTTEGQGGFGLTNHDLLSWSGGPTADHYDVWRNLNNAGFAYLASVPGDESEYDDFGPFVDWVNGTYAYYVLAKNASNVTLATSNTQSCTWPIP